MTPHYLVLGGTKGVGRALAHQLANGGALVSALGRSQPDTKNDHPNLKTFLVDVGHEGSWKQAIHVHLEPRGIVTGLICCQRYRGDASQSWAGEWSVSLDATQRAIRWMAAQCDRPGAIVVIGSAASTFIIGDQPVSYHVAKAALLQMMKYYAVQCGPLGIRVNAVSSGAFVKEESSEFYAAQSEKYARYQSLVPLGRMGHANDLVKAALFLLSDDAGFITGQNLVVDGGLSVRGQEAVALERPTYA